MKRNALILGVSVVTSIGVGFFLGSRYYSEVMESYRENKKAIKAYKKQIADQDQRLVNLEIADKVNRLTQERLRLTVTELKTQQVKLEGELFLYKNLIVDDEVDIGLNLESVYLRPVEGADNTFSYQIVVRRKAALSQTTEVSLSLTIEGKMLGIKDSLELQEVDPEIHEDVLAIRFKYFRVLSGQMVLPEHFEPEQLVVTLFEPGKADSLTIKEIPWRLSQF